MAHYAFLDENNLVTEVIVGKDETELIEGLDPETWYENFRGQVCKRTSYNTLNGISTREGGTPFRHTYAGIGFYYDEQYDVFYYPCMYPSWKLNTTNFTWEAPTPMPTDGKIYRWVEADLNWQVVELPQQ
jgi:hypothetical protein